jgi:hypothetical protein
MQVVVTHYSQPDFFSLLAFVEKIIEGENKKCKICKEVKPLKDFNKHIGHKDNLDTRCRSCVKKQTATRRRILATAPPKSEVCDCCGKPSYWGHGAPKSLVLDHNHKTEEFRGWLCDHCNVGIGLLGDDIEGLREAIKYLQDDECTNIKQN